MRNGLIKVIMQYQIEKLEKLQIGKVSMHRTFRHFI